MDGTGPWLIYDGECAFCAYWVDYWQSLTGERVRYAPYQDVAEDHPSLTRADFARAVRFVDAEGRISAGAEASLRALAMAPGHGAGLWIYAHVPGAARLCEAAYRLVATHRGTALRASRWLWGARHRPACYEATRGLLISGLALVFLIAFVSMAGQVTGLVGSDGLMPVADYLAAVAGRYGIERYWLFPTLFWADASDLALQSACWAGAAVSALLVFRIAPRAGLAAVFVLYLSLFYAGQVFSDFQWDLLLLEAGFLAFATCRRPALLVLLTRWLLFRFMFMSGWVKLTGDESWLGFTALRYHLETQPLPTPLAWTAAQWPDGVLQVATVGVLLIELVLPFCIFLPRRPRFVAAWLFIGLQAAITATGNFGFFNLLVIVLCASLFDDAALPRWLHSKHVSIEPKARWPGNAFAAISLLLGALQLGETWRSPARTDAHARFIDQLTPLRIVNRYGPFKSMTRERMEVVVQASMDGRRWFDIAFRYKPGDIHHAPAWNLPHQPRLDWQMWFAADGTQRENPWFARLMLGVLSGSKGTLALLAPRADASTALAPRYARAMLFHYRYATAAEHAQGQWWTRHEAGLYFPVVQLERPEGEAPRLVPAEGLLSTP